MPLFSVFQILPLATATNHSEWFRGLTAKSAIRPEANAGPILLHFSPENVLDLSFPSSSSLSFSLSFFSKAKPEVKIAIIKMNAGNKLIFRFIVLILEFIKKQATR